MNGKRFETEVSSMLSNAEKSSRIVLRYYTNYAYCLSDMHDIESWKKNQ